MLKGVVRWFNDLKGYGFIASNGLSENIYVHFPDIRISGYRTLKKGDQVFFELEKSPSGVRATNVTKA